MIVTEKEAAEKWCPFARVTEAGSGDGSSWNRLNTEPALDIPATKCVGSACMSWRQAWRHSQSGSVVAHFRPSSDPHWIEVGYCGLAGKVTP